LVTPFKPFSPPSLPRRAAAEGVGTALLLATVVGSGIMGERLSGGNAAIALGANSLATGAGLTALILSFASVSGAHFNPVVTLADAAMGRRPWSDVPPYLAAQVLGAFAGVALAHGMFGEAIFSAARRARGGPGQLLSEFIATFGLLAVIWGCSRRTIDATPFAVGAYITAACWFTALTSFANPAVTLARSATDGFTGIRLGDASLFVGAQIFGAAAAIAFTWWLSPGVRSAVPEVAIARKTDRSAER